MLSCNDEQICWRDVCHIDDMNMKIVCISSDAGILSQYFNVSVDDVQSLCQLNRIVDWKDIVELKVYSDHRVVSCKSSASEMLYLDEDILSLLGDKKHQLL